MPRVEQIDGEHLRKTYDDHDRLVKIEFLLTGKSCEIKYAENDIVTKNVQHITWSDGYTYLTCDNLAENGEVKSHTIVERKNPNTDYITYMEFDPSNHGKMTLFERVKEGKTLFKRATGDFGFDGRLRINERNIALSYRK